MKTPVDLTTWKRRQHFELFIGYENPYYGVTANVDCTRMYERSKSEGFPFYLGYHCASIQAVNANDAFRQRIENGKPVEYGEVHLSTTIERDDGTFGFSFIPLRTLASSLPNDTGKTRCRQVSPFGEQRKNCPDKLPCKSSPIAF